MKKFKKLLILSQFLLIFILHFSSYNIVYGATVSKGECVMEVSSGRILYSKSEDLKLPIASTTKILTALTVIENFDLTKIITVPKEATKIEGSSIYLKEGERLSVLELLYGLMLRSGNDCAYTLASTLTSYDEFIKLMNNTANRLGATNSNFVNPHGLHDDNHYSTAKDLCLITCHALKNKTFRNIVSTKKISISNEFYDYKRVLINKNKLLYNLDGCNGVKTGYTKKAGRCLVTSCNKNGFEVVSVVINSPDMYNRTTELINNAHSEYTLYDIIDKDAICDKVYKTKDGKPFTVKIDKGFSYPLKKTELRSLQITINGQNSQNFFKNPTTFGVFEIFLSNKLIFSQNIYIL